MTRLLPALLLAGLALAPGGAARAGDDDGKPLGGDGGAGPADKPGNDPNAPLHVRVNQAIDSGVAWLKKQTFAGGNWSTEVIGSIKYDPNSKGEDYRHPAGCTALSLYTLLKCGVPANDPVIVKGFEWLRGTAGAAKGKGKGGRVPRGSYEISVLILALEAKSNPHKREKEREREISFHLRRGEKLKTGVKLPADDEAWMRDLVAGLIKRRSSGAGWRYNIDDGQGKFQAGPNGNNNDMSSTQLVMLALLAAERCGISQPDTFYAGMLDWTLKQQDEASEGKVERFQPGRKTTDEERYGGSIAIMDEARGWAYIKKPVKESSLASKESRPSASMTACGLANVVICSNILQARGNADFEAVLAARSEQAWWDGVAWLQSHWSVDFNTNGAQGYHYYWLYCLERVGDLKRVNLVAGHPWYEEGAKVLVDQQEPGGSWNRTDTHEPHDVLNTCFALLFLNRATPAITGE